MRIYFFTFALFLLLAKPLAYAQQELSPRVQNIFLKAENYRNHFSYSKAIENYKQFLTYKTNGQQAMANMADCYFKLKDYTEALVWYDSALRYGKLYPPHGVQYGSLLLSQGMSEKAKTWLREYVIDQPTDKQAKEKLEGLENMEAFFRDSSLYTVTNLSINSSNPEFAPTLYQDGFLFVSGGRKKSDDYLDLYYCNWNNTDSVGVAPFSEKINSKLHEGSLTVYDSDKKIIFTRNNKVISRKLNDISVIYFQLFYSEKNDLGEWTDPSLLSISDKEYSIGHPTITKDGNTLYFSSTIPGGLGGSDIYKSQWENGKWGTPKNLGGEINTGGNEMFPYIFNDSVLYFSSDGYRGLGGLDIYKTNLNKHSGVFNMGYPINTIKDDFSVAIYPDGNKGFFASNRDGGKGNDDLYSFTVNPVNVPEPKAAEPIAPEVFYTVQILALKNPRLVRKTFLKQLKGVIKHNGKDGLHRYTYGEYKGLDEALQMLETIRSKGYQDAFIRQVEKYAELSEAPGENIDLLYEKMGRVK